MSDISKLLLEILLPIITALSGLITFLIVRIKKFMIDKEKQRERSNRINEAYNYCGAVTDTFIRIFEAKTSDGSYAIKLDPDIREALLREAHYLSETYHSFDLKNKSNI